MANLVLEFPMVPNGTHLETNCLFDILIPEINYLSQKMNILRVSEQSNVIQVPSIKQACTVCYPMNPLEKFDYLKAGIKFLGKNKHTQWVSEWSNMIQVPSGGKTSFKVPNGTHLKNVWYS